VARYERDSSFIANTVKISNPVLTVYRDKKPPSSPYSKEKPLPVDMIKNLTLPVLLESLLVENGTITYSEKHGTSGKTGTLLFTDVSASLGNIKNSDISASDSLLVTFKANLMDAGNINLRLKESYADSLKGFFMTTTMKPMDISLLNPFIVPVANVKIASGRLDSVSFGAVGRQDVALGEMDMHYHDLRIQLITDGDPAKSTTMQKVIGFIANTFVIKSKNTNRKGTIYYKHKSNQSFINYIVKTTLTGLTSSVGAKKNRKYIKQYKQELKESNLPAITQYF